MKEVDKPPLTFTMYDEFHKGFRIKAPYIDKFKNLNRNQVFKMKGAKSYGWSSPFFAHLTRESLMQWQVVLQVELSELLESDLIFVGQYKKDDGTFGELELPAICVEPVA